MLVNLLLRKPSFDTFSSGDRPQDYVRSSRRQDYCRPNPLSFLNFQFFFDRIIHCVVLFALLVYLDILRLFLFLLLILWTFTLLT